MDVCTIKVLLTDLASSINYFNVQSGKEKYLYKVAKKKRKKKMLL